MKSLKSGFCIVGIMIFNMAFAQEIVQNSKDIYGKPSISVSLDEFPVSGIVDGIPSNKNIIGMSLSTFIPIEENWSVDLGIAGSFLISGAVSNVNFLGFIGSQYNFDGEEKLKPYIFGRVILDKTGDLVVHSGFGVGFVQDPVMVRSDIGLRWKSKNDLSLETNSAVLFLATEQLNLGGNLNVKIPLNSGWSQQTFGFRVGFLPVAESPREIGIHGQLSLNGPVLGFGLGIDYKFPF